MEDGSSLAASSSVVHRGQNVVAGGENSLANPRPKPREAAVTIHVGFFRRRLPPQGFPASFFLHLTDSRLELSFWEERQKSKRSAREKDLDGSHDD